MKSELMTFCCEACGITLNVPRAMAGISGPCPSCERVITAPRDDAPAPSWQMPPAPVPAPMNDEEPDRVLRRAPTPPRPPTAGPPEKSGIFSRIGVWLFLLLLASPLLVFGGMMVDMKGMFDNKQVENQNSDETALINMIDQIVHPGDPKWQQEPNDGLTRGAALIEGQRMNHEEEAGTTPLEIGRLLSTGADQ
ncbi:MAG: hypothetical protein U1F81_17725 [Verrucomicrobiaceae bacterium]